MGRSHLGRLRVPLLPLLLLLLLLLVVVVTGTSATNSSLTRSGAYVTYVHSDDWALGAMVLGRSIQDTGSPRPLIALVDTTVSPSFREYLEEVGWDLQMRDSKDLPTGPPLALDAMQTLLRIRAWSMTQYERIVLLAPHTLMLLDSDDLFACGMLCAATRSQQWLQPDVIVLKPDLNLYHQMKQRLLKGEAPPSFPEFINAQFPDIIRGQFFSSKADTNNASCNRLNDRFNHDTALFYQLGMRWILPMSDIQLISFLGLRPWNWMYYPFFPLGRRWNNVRLKLTSFNDMTDAAFSRTQLAFLVSVWLLFFLSGKVYQKASYTRAIEAAFRFYRNAIYGRGSSASSAGGVTLPSPSTEETILLYSPLPVVVGLGCFFFALWMGQLVVFEYAAPWQCWVTFLEVFFLVLLSLYGHFLHICYIFGRMAPSLRGSNGLKSPIASTVTALSILVFYACFFLPFYVPLVEDVFRGKMVLFFGPIFGSLPFFLCCVLFLSVQLPAIWYRYGQTRSRGTTSQ